MTIIRTEDEIQAIISAGHPPSASKRILIDFDGTISPFGNMFTFAQPFDGIKDFLDELKVAGYTIGIFTSRLSPTWIEADQQDLDEHKDYIYAYMLKYSLPFDFMTCEKMPCEAYIDDKAITFKNNWQEIREQFFGK